MTNIRLVDSHCHLNYPEFQDDMDGVVARAKDVGVIKILTISTKLSQMSDLLAITEKYPDIYATVGVHPHDVQEEGVPTYDALLRLTQKEKIVGIGETGLDYYYEHTDRVRQKESFRTHIKVAAETNLPLIIHSREAEEDILMLLREENVADRKNPGVIHCFTGTGDFAKAAIDMGFYISISGVVTFKKADVLRDIVLDLPLDRLLVETDAPYLAPVPHRGKPNEPSFVRHTAQVVADLKGLSLAEVGEVTTENFFTLFQKVS